MDYHSLYQKSVLELRKIAKENKVRVPAGTSKAMIVQLILEGVEREGDASVVKPKSIDQEVRRASMGRPGRPPMKQESIQRGPTAAEIEQGILSVKRPEVMPEERPAVRSSYAMRMREGQFASSERFNEDYNADSDAWDGAADDLYAAGMSPDAKTESAEIKSESPVAKTESAAAKTEPAEAKAESPEAKAEPAEAKIESPAAKAEPAEAKAEAPVVKKRGRPRKIRDESQTAPVAKKTRGRSRPEAAEAGSEQAAKLNTEAGSEQAAKLNTEAAEAVSPANSVQSDSAAAQSTEAVGSADKNASGQAESAPQSRQTPETVARPSAEAPAEGRVQNAVDPVAAQNAPRSGEPVRGYVRRSPGRNDAYRPASNGGAAGNRPFSSPVDGARRPMLPRQRFEGPRGNADSRYENARGNAESRYENARGNADSRYENARGNAESRYENARGNADSRYENARGNVDSRYENARGNADSRYENARGYHGDESGEVREATQSSDLVYRDDPVQRTLQAQRAVGYENGYRRMETENFNPQSADFADGAGLLEIQPDGYGFLRAENCLPGSKDVYISIAQIRRFGLRPGDFVEGKTRPQREGDRYSALVYINRVNGESPELAVQRKPFESLVPWYPTERLRMENPLKPDISMRMIDVVAPIGKGQRGMIVSQPKAGKTTLLKKIANSIADNNPEVKLIVLLIDERPEEVTDMKRSIRGDVIYSTFDSAPENHTRVSEMVLAHAQRLVESGKDVVILLDSITRLARAYNLTIPPTGRSLSGGLDPGALYKPKKFFGAARNIENGGSLTIIATALVDTGSRMDDIIFEEFKGTGNMELHLDRRLSDKRIFPAIDMLRSGTRREELLLTPEEREGEFQARRMLSAGGGQQSTEQLIALMEKTVNNVDFFRRLKGWMSVYEKEGFTLGGKSDRG